MGARGLFLQNVLEVFAILSFFFLLKKHVVSSSRSAVRLIETIKQNIVESFFRIWEVSWPACLG